MAKLPLEFYTQEEVCFVAKSMLGKTLVVEHEDCVLKAKIVETEAYNGVVDKASHAFGDRFTSRTKTMYLAGGVSYVYLCYGIHHLFNVVTGIEGDPKAVLIRAVEPLEGTQKMLNNRRLTRFSVRVTSGPGALTQAMGISTLDNGVSLLHNRIYLEEGEDQIEPIVETTRIGVDYAKEDALLPYRYYLSGNSFVSKPVKRLK